MVFVSCSKKSDTNFELQVNTDPIEYTQIKVTGTHSSGRQISVNDSVVCKKTEVSQVLNIDFTSTSYAGLTLETDLKINTEVTNQISVQTLSFVDSSGLEVSGSAFDMKDCTSNVGQVKNGHRIEIKCQDFVDENGQEYSSLNVVAECYDDKVKAQ
jgi:hypothetical protein